MLRCMRMYTCMMLYTAYWRHVITPLGSKRTIHKLGTPNECSPIRSHSKTSICFIGLFYFVLGNLSPMYRSHLSSIQLVIVVENKFIKKYEMNAVLEPFVTDVGKLVSAICVYFCARITVNVKNTAGRRIHFPSTWMPPETLWYSCSYCRRQSSI